MKLAQLFQPFLFFASTLAKAKKQKKTVLTLVSRIVEIASKMRRIQYISGVARLFERGPNLKIIFHRGPGHTIQNY